MNHTLLRNIVDQEGKWLRREEERSENSSTTHSAQTGRLVVSTNISLIATPLSTPHVRLNFEGESEHFNTSPVVSPSNAPEGVIFYIYYLQLILQLTLNNCHFYTP